MDLGTPFLIFFRKGIEKKNRRREEGAMGGSRITHTRANKLNSKPDIAELINYLVLNNKL